MASYVWAISEDLGPKIIFGGKIHSVRIELETLGLNF